VVGHARQWNHAAAVPAAPMGPCWVCPAAVPCTAMGTAPPLLLLAAAGSTLHQGVWAWHLLSQQHCVCVLPSSSSTAWPVC
jgi:hypothetical protein